ncbi:MFS transporter [Alteribacter keqinensis]|nr:MFS transporter [Alteribacter keqinensis]
MKKQTMRKFIITAYIGVLIGTAANMMMQTVIATILPSITEELGGLHLYGWVFSSFLIISTVTIPFFSKMADIYGHKQLFSIGLMVFTAGTLFCGMAESIETLIAGRVIQGVGAGAVAPAAIALISTLFTRSNRGKALALYGITQMTANIAGPLVGGGVARLYSWEWAFYIIVPVCLLSLLLIYLSRHSGERIQKQGSALKSFDFLGALLLGISVIATVQGLTRLGHTGWSLLTFVFFVSSFVTAFWFIQHERKHPAPIIPKRLISKRLFSLSLINACLGGMVMYGIIAILPLFAVSVLEGPLQTNPGVLLIPLMVGVGGGSLIGGMIMKKTTDRTAILSGWILVNAGLVIFFVMNVSGMVNSWAALIILFIGLGIGILSLSIITSAQNAAGENEQAVAGGVIQLARNLGGGIGIPVLTVFLSLGSSEPAGINHFTFTFLFLSISSFIGFTISFFWLRSHDII